MRHRPGGRFGIAGLDPQRADTVAIDAEILVAAVRGNDLIANVEQPEQSLGILFEPAREALVGDVDERQQATLGDDPRDFGELLVAQVGASWIVAAAV